MPDISKINAVAIADIEKLDSILAANIAKVDGLVFSTAFVGLLDETYGSGAEAAYSVRRLASATTVLLRVRRDTGTGGAEDDDEADVSYDSNNQLSLNSAISNASAGVAATTLGQFINVGTVNGTTYTNSDNLTVTASCFVDTWYDQSGNANDAEQTAFGSQPQIHNGTVNTDLITENGKPILTAVNGSTDIGAASVVSGPIYLFSVVKVSQQSILLSTGPSTWAMPASSGSSTTQMSSNATITSTFKNGSSYTLTTWGDNYTAFNTQSLFTIDTSIGFAYLGFPASGSFAMYSAQEVIVYDADQSSNRTDIEDNINAEFGIY